ncbi:hypothetical protein ACIBG8_14025 [Nonomuraea sp. NPDC050556]|uniref:hypothetical protein n=1 Tax=Nonomuraea sp. NPDC050556 TaxID=3364369 RepID=UPI0037A7AB71
MRMGMVVLALAVPMSLLSCGSATAGGVEPGKVFTLAVGDTARLADPEYAVTLTGVGQDSRCPEGVQCVWEGDAVVTVRITAGTAAPTEHELHTNARFATAVTVAGHELRLVALNPHPKQGVTLAADSYRADFTLQ